MVTIGHQRRDRVQQAVDVGDASRVTDLLLQRQQPVRGRGWSLICQDHTDPIVTHLLRRSSSIRVVIVATVLCVDTSGSHFFPPPAFCAFLLLQHHRGTCARRQRSPSLRRNHIHAHNPPHTTHFPRGHVPVVEPSIPQQQQQRKHTQYTVFFFPVVVLVVAATLSRGRRRFPSPHNRTRRAASAGRWRERERRTSPPSLSVLFLRCCWQQALQQQKNSPSVFGGAVSGRSRLRRPPTYIATRRNRSFGGGFWRPKGRKMHSRFAFFLALDKF